MLSKIAHVKAWRQLRLRLEMVVLPSLRSLPPAGLGVASDGVENFLKVISALSPATGTPEVTQPITWVMA